MAQRLSKQNSRKKGSERGSGALLDAFERIDLQENHNSLGDQYEDLLQDTANYKKSRANHDFEDDVKYQGVKVSKNTLYNNQNKRLKDSFSDLEISEEENEEEDVEENELQSEENTRASLNNMNIDKFIEEIDEQDQEIISTKKDRQREIKKAKAVKHQQILLDNMFEARVKMQETLKLTNRIPYPDTLSSLSKIDASKEIRTNLQELKVEVIDLLDMLDDITVNYHKKSESGCAITANKRLEKCQNYLKENHVSSKEFITSYQFDTGQIWNTLDKTFEAQSSYFETTISTWAQKFNMLNQNSIKGRFANIYQTPTQQTQKAMEDFDRLAKRSQVKDSTLKPLFEIGESSDNYSEEIYNDEEFYLAIFREMLQKQAQMDSQNIGNEDFLIGNTQLYLKNRQLKAKPKKEVDRRASKNRKIRYDVHPKLMNFMAPVENIQIIPGRDHLLKNLFGLYEEMQDKPKNKSPKTKASLRKKVKKSPEENEVEINLL